MVRKSESDKSRKSNRTPTQNVQVDVIILGCTLPGIVTAHKLKRKFGNTMDIVVLDMATADQKVPSSDKSKGNVSFRNNDNDHNIVDSQNDCDDLQNRGCNGHQFLTNFAQQLNIPLPPHLLSAERNSYLNKLFQHTNGHTVECLRDFHDFEFLNFVEKFELTQYQTLLDASMRNLFNTNKNDAQFDRKLLLYYDKTTMEQHLCDALLFPTSREIMRTTVRIVCGSSADTVSVLFYLHQCYRTNSSRNHLDGDSARTREKLIGYCRNRITNQLQQSIADITIPSKPIKEIRTYSDERVILRTMKGETSYVCNLLAMALRPDELRAIDVEEQLLNPKDLVMIRAMAHGRARKFAVKYESNFWTLQGYSGDILSIKGPIIWATEKPKLSTTGSMSRYSTIAGYLKGKGSNQTSNKFAVLEQLVRLFGEEAASPVSYEEADIADVFVPRCGDYVALSQLTEVGRKCLEWASLDVFADGDVAAALQAGHTAYLHLLSCLRPQAQTFEDLSSVNMPVALTKNHLEEFFCEMNYKRGIKLMIYTVAIYVGIGMLRSYFKK